MADSPPPMDFEESSEGKKEEELFQEPKVEELEKEPAKEEKETAQKEGNKPFALKWACPGLGEKFSNCFYFADDLFEDAAEPFTVTQPPPIATERPHRDSEPPTLEPDVVETPPSTVPVPAPVPTEAPPTSSGDDLFEEKEEEPKPKPIEQVCVICWAGSNVQC